MGSPVPSRPVNPRLHALLVVLCLLWQPLGALLPAALEQRAQAIGHALVHEQAVDHHHHDDASLRLDGADEAPHHHLLDGGQPPALVVQVASIEPAAPATGVRADETMLPPSAVLEGPLRPPRAPRA
jgi:hypothetical protein